MLDSVFGSSQIEVSRDIVVVHHEEGPVLSQAALKSRILTGLAHSAGNAEYLVNLLTDFLEDNGVTVL